jgi:hypothetical protein
MKQKIQKYVTFLNVFIEKFTFDKSLQWQNDMTVHRLHKFCGDIVLDYLVQFFR